MGETTAGGETVLLNGTPQRASGALGYHVLEVLLGAIKSAETRETVVIESTNISA